jgi:hypothetical protein
MQSVMLSVRPKPWAKHSERIRHDPGNFIGPQSQGG